MRQKFVLAVALVVGWSLTNPVLGTAWRRHTIDASSRGADGVRMLDVNGDTRPDIVTAWEEGGVVRICFHPGEPLCRKRWPSVTVGKVRSGEDALLHDIDADGRIDVVSSCEGSTRSMFIHWAPIATEKYRDSTSWTTQSIPATAGKQMWMFAAPMNVDDRHAIDLAVSSKGSQGSVGWLEAPRDARDIEAWKFHRLRRVGWVMSLVPHDMDEDGDLDLVVSDRKGSNRGIFWLENPRPLSSAVHAMWQEHAIGGDQFEVMFLDLCDLDADGKLDVLAATRAGQMLLLRNNGRTDQGWRELTIPNPFGVPHGKAVRVGDIDRDGTMDIVHTANTGGDRRKPGVAWMKRRETDVTGPWKAFDVSGDRGVKFDLIELVDLDQDGDLDILTCEERDNLGVVWYENPGT